MEDIKQLLETLSEKSKALTHDSGRWDATQLARKTKEVTELLPTILDGILDAIAEIPEKSAPVIRLEDYGITELGQIGQATPASIELVEALNHCAGVTFQGFYYPFCGDIHDVIQIGHAGDDAEVGPCFGTLWFDSTDELSAASVIVLYNNIDGSQLAKFEM